MSFRTYYGQRTRNTRLSDEGPMLATCDHSYPDKCTKFAVLIEGNRRLCTYHYELNQAKRGCHGNR